MSEPPAWLARLADRSQIRLMRIWQRLVPPADEGHDEPPSQKSARFEQKWGVYYLPLALVVVLWLVLMAMWDRI